MFAQIGPSCVRNSMKLFQQLLVAPAALGLLASGANAAELNINGVSDYAASADQVTSVTQFSDVYPTPPTGLIRLWPDWLRPTAALPATPTAPSVATVP